MTKPNKKKIILAKTDADGWIKTRKDKYGFAEESHVTRSSISHPNRASVATVTPTRNSTATASLPNEIYKSVPNPYSTRTIPETKVADVKRELEPRDSTATASLKNEVHKCVPNPYVTRTPRPAAKVAEVKREHVLKEALDDTSTDPSSLDLIKKTHKLFFTYDPRGNKTKPFPKGYCEDCLCPLNYCAEIVFGEMSKNHALTKVYTPGKYHDTSDRGSMKAVFDEAYTEAVFSKLRWNGFDFIAIEEKESWRNVRIPLCMKRKSLKRFLKQIRQNNDEEYDIACQSYTMYDEEAEIEEALKNGDFNSNHPIMKRVTAEQSQNIAVMFKKVKSKNDN